MISAGLTILCVWGLPRGRQESGMLNFNLLPGEDSLSLVKAHARSCICMGGSGVAQVLLPIYSTISFLGLMHMAALWLHFVLVYLKFHTEEYRNFFCRIRKSDRKIKKYDVSGNNPACWWSTVCKGFFTLLKTVQREFKLDVIFYDNIANPDKKIKPLSTFKIGYKILLIKYISISLRAL